MEDFWDSLYSMQSFFQFLLGGLIIGFIRFVIPFIQYKVAQNKVSKTTIKGTDDIFSSQKEISDRLYSFHSCGEYNFIFKKSNIKTANSLKNNKSKALLKILLHARIRGCKVEIRQRKLNEMSDSEELFVSSQNKI